MLPLTLDEATRTLLYYKDKLSRLDVTPLLGRATLRSESWLSGITQKYLQAAEQGKSRLSAEAYFEPYLSDLLVVARNRDIELFNENTAKLGTRQDVVDDILSQQEREKARGDRAKPCDAIHHDVVLWHCVEDRRTVTETVDVVSLLRAELIPQLEWAGPEATDAVLSRVATVPYRGDVHAYLAEAMTVARAALTAAIQPRLDALIADAAMWRAKADEIEAQHAESMREFERFRTMVTSDHVH